MATDHDSLDHGHAAQAHPSIHLKKARLSWQEPLNAEPPAPWKIILVVGLVILALGGLELLKSWRVGVHMAHMQAEIRQNVIILATAADQYMTTNHVDTVNEPKLIGPGEALQRQPSTVIGESYENIEFSLADPKVWVHIPSSGQRLNFEIRWHHPDAPDFVSDPTLAPFDNTAQ